MSPEQEKENKHRHLEDDMAAAVDPKSQELAEKMQEQAEHLTNGSKGDLRRMSEGIAVMLDSQKHMQDKVDRLPTRPEVREMIISHAQTCALARGDSASSFSFGKSGFRASGRAVTWVAVAAVVLLGLSAPYIASWISAWKGEKLAEAREEASREAKLGAGPRGATNVVFVSGIESAYYDESVRTMFIPKQGASR